MANGNSNEKTVKIIAGAAVVTAAGILVSKKGEDLNAAELAEVAKAMEEIQPDNIKSIFYYGKKGDQKAEFSTKDNRYGLGDTYSGLTKESVSATLITDKDGKVIGWYYKTAENKYNVFYNGKPYDNVTAELDQNGVKFKSGDQEIFTSDPTSGEVTAGDSVVGTATPPPSDGSDNLDIYKSDNTIKGYIDTTTGRGWFENLDHGTQKDDLSAVRNQYLKLINEKVVEGSLDADMGEKLKQAILDIDTDSIRTTSEFNQAVQSKIAAVEKMGSFSKGYDYVCKAFDDSLLVQKINEFAGSNVVNSEAITTLAIVGGITAVGLAILKNKDKIDKVFVSLASSFPSKSSGNSYSRD